MTSKIKPFKSSRRRGVVLTTVGLKRLQAAIQTLEIEENRGERWSLEQLCDRTNVSTKTLSRLWSLHTKVDQKTLKLCFTAFNLELSPEDYLILDEPNQLDLDEPEVTAISSITQDLVHQDHYTQPTHLEAYPDGPVTLDSPFYIERPPIEELAYREIIYPGCLIRIRAPKEMGKSSLVLRILAFAQKQGHQTIIFNCNQIDSSYFDDLNKLLRCLAKQVGQTLGIRTNLDDYWDDEIGCKLSCSFYLHHVLKNIQNPVVLVLNEVDRFFEHPQLAQDFFTLLRSWYEEGRQDSDWQKLRLVVVYSTEEYVKLDINCSPFNIGLPLRLPELTQQQVAELANRYDLDWSSEQSSQLMNLVGGHPALIRIAFYYLCTQGMTFEDLMQEALADGGVYRYHLWRHWTSLQKNPHLVKILKQILTNAQGSYVDSIQGYKLESLGLICYDGDRIRLRCELYYAYFKKQLL